MSVYHGHAGLPQTARGAVAALGNFDGVHRGHAAVIGEAKALAAALGAPSAAAVFTPHPRLIFQPDAEPFALMSETQRVRALQAEGVEIVHHIAFDRTLASMTPEAFVETVLARGLGLAGVVTGSDFCFGKDRAGDAAALKQIGARHGIEARIAKAVSDDGAEGKISSSDVRKALRAGEPEAAAALLGRPFAIEGAVAEGDKRGRTIGFPTANMALGGYVRPAFGVYAVRARLGDGRTVPGVANLGRRPTVEGTEARLETHLFDFTEDIYGRTLEVELLSFIRGETKFDGLDQLKAQIATDCDTARKILAAR
ncbi:MAG: bifunctional riboflavin kinase/FAD synthetase [Oceanicaulis sp.]